MPTTPKVAALPHQRAGTQFLRSRTAAALFDEQGLGKSKQLIDAIAEEINAGALDGALIVCPNILKGTWGEEVERHSSMRYAVFGAGHKARREAFRSLRAAIYVINYEAVPAEIASLRALLRFKRLALVLDESHRIKTPTAKITRAILSLRADAKKRYIMTGTPVANKPDDVWSQMLFLDDGVTLGPTFDGFKRRYRLGTGYRNINDLRDKLAAVSLRREKEGTIDLPSKEVVRLNVRLTGRQNQLYVQLRDELAIWIRAMNGEEVLRAAENILARLVTLAQLASNPKLLDSSYIETPAKFVALDKLVPLFAAESAGKLIIWTSFVDNIPILLSRYDTLFPVAIYGDVDTKSRNDAVSSFKRDSRVRLLIANPAAAREGLTLTEARTAVYLDRTFNLVDFLQSQDRIHRLSQQYACQIVLLIAENTIDEFIDFTLAQKHRLARFVQSDQHDISPDDLALQKPAILQALLSPSIHS